MKKFLLAFFPLFIVVGISAQSIVRDAMTNGGGFSQTTNAHFSYSLGQTVVQTVSSDNIILTQGFQQSGYKMDVSINNQDIQIAYSVYPNPSSGEFKVEISSDLLIDGKLQIRDILGKLIHTVDLVANVYHLHSIDFDQYDSGIYLISLISVDQQVLFNQKLSIQH